MDSNTRRERHNMRRPWSNLPEKALISITQFTDSRFDIIHLRAVCGHWRKNVPPPSKPSHKLPMLLYISNDHCVTPGHDLISVYKLYKTTVFLLEDPESTAKWLITISERSFEKKVCLLNPFSSHDIGKYFPKYAFPNKVINLLKLRITQVSTRYNMRLLGVSSDEDNDSKSENLELNFKLVDESMLTYDVSHKAQLVDEFTRFDSFSVITYLSKLRSVSFSSEDWTTIGRKADHYCDIVVHNDFFYFVDRNGVVVGIYYNCYEIEQVIRPPLSFLGEWYLVKAGGDLYLVGRDFRVCERQVYYSHEARCFVAKSSSEPPIPVVFHVFVLNCENPLEPKWVALPNINDYIFFVSRKGSFAIEAAACYSCQGNCIIFVDEIKYDDHNVPQNNSKYAIKELGGVKVGVYDAVEGTNRPLSECPFHFRMFWPPPHWLAMMNTCTCSGPYSSRDDSIYEA